MQKIAAIDIGSNAIRMIVGRVTDSAEVQLVENIRLPVRLGQDVFTLGKLQETTMQQAVEGFQHFRRIANDWKVTRIRAIATSAMREASNGHILMDRIVRTAQIFIEVINGDEEARLIHRAVANVIPLNGKRAVLIDIGGGSVEVTLSQNGRIISTESHPLGAVRLLQNLKEGHGILSLLKRSDEPFITRVRTHAEPVRKKISSEIGTKKVDLCIATGGNVEEIGRLGQKYLHHPSPSLIRLEELQTLIELLNSLSLERRMEKLKLKPDRADVILPAAVILELIALEARAKQIHIPGVGLKDGLLAEMVDEERES